MNTVRSSVIEISRISVTVVGKQEVGVDSGLVVDVDEDGGGGIIRLVDVVEDGGGCGFEDVDSLHGDVVGGTNELDEGELCLEDVTCDDNDEGSDIPEVVGSSHGVVTLVLVVIVIVVTNDWLVGLLQGFIVPLRVVETVTIVSDVSHGVVLGWGPYLEVVVGIKLFSVGLSE